MGAMTHVLVLGAGGQIPRWVIEMLKNSRDVELTLFLRRTQSLKQDAPKNAKVVQGDVLKAEQLNQALVGQDLDVQARAIVAAMKTANMKRLIFVTSLGIYDEIPGVFGEWNRREIGAYLPPFRRAADAIEASGLDYTLLRPAWLTDHDEIDYETTEKGEPFKGTEVSRKSVADLIVKIIQAPSRHSKGNIGVDKPGTEGDKPVFF